MQKMLQRLVREDIEVVTVLEPYLGTGAGATPDQMSQILINLAANARDAMPEGGKLCIRTANVELREGRPPEMARLCPVRRCCLPSVTRRRYELRDAAEHL